MSDMLGSLLADDEMQEESPDLVEQEEMVEEAPMPPLEKVLSNFMGMGEGLSRGAADLILGMDDRTPMRSRSLMTNMLDSIYEQGGDVTVEQLEQMAWDAGIPGAATIPSRSENLPTLVREALTSALALEGYTEEDMIGSMDDIVNLALGGGN